MRSRPCGLSLLALLALPPGCGDDDTPTPLPYPSVDAAPDVTRDAAPPDAPPDAAPDAALDAAVDAPRWEGAARVTVTRYDYAIDLATRVVTARLTMRVDRAGDCLSIGFRHAAADEVRFDDAPARDVTVANGALQACDAGGRGWAAGATVAMSVTSTEPLGAWRPTQVGFSTRASVSGGGTFTYLLSWVGECARHGACDATPSAFATFRFAVTHPEGTQVLCPGAVTPGATMTVCDFNFRGGPTYSTFGVLAMSNPWREVALGAARNVRLTLHDTPASRIAETLRRDQLQAFVRWMIDRFGPYPYGDDLRLVTAPTYWAGFEHPGNIALAQTLGPTNAEHTVHHEVAHQWAGDQTTVATVKDFAWKESMAEYLSYVFEDETMDRDAASTTLNVWRLSATSADHWIVPDEDIPLVSYYGSAYGAGPMILFRQLEVMYSRRQVLDALRMLLGRERSLTLDEVRMALEATTGADLANYFRVWAHGAGAPAWPAAAVARTANADGSVTVRVTLTSRDGVARPCRFTVRLTGDGGRSLDVPVVVGLDGAPPAPITVRPDFAVTGEVINPLFEALVFPMTAASGARWIEHVPTGRYNPLVAPGESP